MILESEPLLIKDGVGNVIEASPLITGKRRRFKQYFALAARLMQEHTGDHYSLYDGNEFFRIAVNTCLEQFGLNGSNLDMRLIVLLLFSRPVVEPETGEVHWGNGFLVDWEFPAAPSEGVLAAMEGIDTELQDLAVLWVAGGGSLPEIFDLADRVPHRDLIAIAEARGYLLEQAKAKAKGASVTEKEPPKIVDREGNEVEFDVAAEMEQLRNDLIDELIDGQRPGSWKEVRLAGIA